MMMIIGMFIVAFITVDAITDTIVTTIRFAAGIIIIKSKMEF